jgi:arabinofuranosyltransferase
VLNTGGLIKPAKECLNSAARKIILNQAMEWISRKMQHKAAHFGTCRMALPDVVSEPDAKGKRWALLLVLLAGVSLIVGWRWFWFLTDDAYISFRYISNSILGHGYVWNPAPFRPVEGYTNFLWVVLLDVVWRVFGAEPPQSANYLSLSFSLFSLILVSWMVLRIRWNESLRRYRFLFWGLVLVAITTNRTFLAWTSSGLETSMFNFLLVLWVCCCLLVPPSGIWWVFSVTSAATLMSLTRPDGLLFLAATAVMLSVSFVQRRAAGLRFKRLMASLPVLAVPAHFIWRRATYGQWLPNTFYAKYTGIWPESGIRYALSFILEYALWVWLALVVYFLAVKIKDRLSLGRAGANESQTANLTATSSSEGISHRIILIAVCAALVVHASYYTFVIGGDHFEYRVYSQLILLIIPSFVLLLNAVRLKARLSLPLLGAFILLSYPIPWTHWALTHNLNTREQTYKLRMSVSDHWPAFFRWYSRPFDRLQFWLIDHYVCVRHQEHKVNCEFLKSLFPSREEGLLLPSDHYPVFAFPAVGVVSWALPKINIIDQHGINDYVIARTPPVRSRIRMMAHEKQAPPGYVECFSPNVRLFDHKKVVVFPREKELTAEDIENCEKTWAERVKQMKD